MVTFALNHTQEGDSTTALTADSGLLVGQSPGLGPGQGPALEQGQGLYKGPWTMTSAQYPVLAKCDPYLIHSFT